MRLPFTMLICAACAACGDDHSAVAAADAAAQPPDAPVPQSSLDDFTDAERAILATLSPLGPVPADTTNAFADDPKAAALGQRLFFDKAFSGPLAVGDDGSNGGLGQPGEAGKVACASCHAVGSDALDDRRTRPNNVSLGTGFTTRNALGLVNSSYYAWTNWAGRFDSQWSLPLAVLEGGATMHGTRLQMAHVLFAKYRAEYDAIFPVPLDPALDPAAVDAARFPATGKPGDAAFDEMTPEDQAIINRIFTNYGKALAAYLRTLVSGNAPFDRYVAGDLGAVSDPAKRGLHLFLAHCAGCHRGPNFADDDFHALGVPQTGDHVPEVDAGRFPDVGALLASPFNVDGVFSDDRATGKLGPVVPDDAQIGQFRTKGLRNVAGSGPFMHAGQFATLDDVIAFYDAGGGDVTGSPIVKDPLIQPLGLDAQQRADLVAFLATLTGEPVPAERLVDTSK